MPKSKTFRSRRKSYEAFKNHIAKESTLVHDKERSQGMLVKELELINEFYKSDEIRQLPDKENPLRCVNEVHARLKDFLRAHSGFNRDSLQGCLNLFCLAMNPPSDYLEKMKLLLNFVFKTRKTLRYRSFYCDG